MVVTSHLECLVDLQKYPGVFVFQNLCVIACITILMAIIRKQLLVRVFKVITILHRPWCLFTETLAIHLSTFLFNNPDWSILEIGPGRAFMSWSNQCIG